MVHSLTPEQEADIVRRYKAGEGAKPLADELGHGSDKAVLRILRKHGAYEPGRKYQGRYTPAEKSDMVVRYEAGETYQQIADHYGCGIINVRDILLRRGVTPRRGGRRPSVTDETLALVRARRESGATNRDIAKELGVRAVDIVRWARRLGLSTDTRGPGPASTGWKGGRIRAPGGYVAVWVAPDDPLRIMAWHNGYALEHRLVRARSLGRPLTADETVHHVNSDKTDNRLENLQLRQGKHGKGARFVCLDCGSHNVAAANI